MFQQTLLESSPAARKHARWPMATSFSLQMIAASVLVIVPLLSTGMIPLSSHLTVVASTLAPAHKDAHPQRTGPSSGVSVARAAVVPVSSTHNIIGPFGWQSASPDESAEAVNLPVCTNCTGPAIAIPTGRPIVTPPVEQPKQRIKISQLSPGMLLRKVVPEYPRVAIPAGIQGEVKLHAIIGKDGSIQSLSVISGHPLLTSSALQAVSQWQYRPYLLNDQPVEVETYITVTFTRGH